MKVDRRYLSAEVWISPFFAFVAVLALAPQPATAQQTAPAAAAPFSFIAYGDSRPMMN